MSSAGRRFTPAVNTKGKTVGYINPELITSRTTHNPSTPIVIETSSSSRAEKVLRVLFVTDRSMTDFMRLNEKLRTIIVNLELSIFKPEERQFITKSCFQPCNWWIDETGITEFIDLKKLYMTPAIQLIRANDQETIEVQTSNGVSIDWIELFEKFSKRCDLPHMMQTADKIGATMPKYAWGAALEVAICEKNRECFDYLTSRPDLCELSLMMSIVWCVKCGALDFLPTIIEMGGDPTSIPYQQRRILEHHAHKPSVDWLLTHCNYYIHKRGHHYD